MSLKPMRGPAGVNILQMGGNNYMPNDDGIFFIPESHMIAAMAHNFKPVNEADLQGANNVSELSARAIEQKTVFPETATNVSENPDEQFTGEAAAEADTLAANPEGEHVVDPKANKGKKGR